MTFFFYIYKLLLSIFAIHSALVGTIKPFLFQRSYYFHSNKCISKWILTRITQLVLIRLWVGALTAIDSAKKNVNQYFFSRQYLSIYCLFCKNIFERSDPIYVVI